MREKQHEKLDDGQTHTESIQTAEDIKRLLQWEHDCLHPTHCGASREWSSDVVKLEQSLADIYNWIQEVAWHPQRWATKNTTDRGIVNPSLKGTLVVKAEHESYRFAKTNLKSAVQYLTTPIPPPVVIRLEVFKVADYLLLIATKDPYEQRFLPVMKKYLTL